MSELRLSEAPPRPQLLHAVAVDLHQQVPGFRRLAEEILAEESRIDLVGVAGDGAAVLVSVGEADDALTRLGRLLAQRRWLEPRLADWLKLAPSLGIRLELPIRIVLVCPRFGGEVRAAAAAIDADGLQLVRYRGIRNGSGVDLLLEPDRADEPVAPETGTGSQPLLPGPEPSDHVPSASPGFRTGLSDADLDLTAAERAEFE